MEAVAIGLEAIDTSNKKLVGTRTLCYVAECTWDNGPHDIQCLRLRSPSLDQQCPRFPTLIWFESQKRGEYSGGRTAAKWRERHESSWVLHRFHSWVQYLPAEVFGAAEPGPPRPSWIGSGPCVSVRTRRSTSVLQHGEHGGCERTNAKKIRRW